MYDPTIPQLDKMLGNLDNWLDEATTWAEAREFDVDRLVSARLFPDMHALDAQVQAACDAAKFIAARLGGIDAPPYPDEEDTLTALRERIAKTRAFLGTVTPEQLEGGGERELYLPFLQGGYVTGTEYVSAFGWPNFYFHITTAYALLRQAGVKLGKRTFIGGMDVRQP